MAGAASLASVGIGAPGAAAAPSPTAGAFTPVLNPSPSSGNVWDRVAECESNGNWSINTGNGYYGGLQFWHPTWKSFGGQEFAPYAHQASKIQQITIAQRVLQSQGPGAWPVCSVRAGLTMENGSAPYPGQPSPTPPAASGTWYVSVSAGANIRAGAGTHFAVVGGAARGTKITGTMSNGWVKLADGRGWISGTTLSTTPPGSSPAPAPTPPPADPGVSTWRVQAPAGANIRSGPSLQHSVVGAVAHRTVITGTMSNGWVKLSDGRGWISGTILQAESGSGGGGAQMAPLVLDGSRGPLTIKAIQHWVGVSQSGVWNQSTIRALQAKVGTSVDGSWGPASQAALQNFLGMTRDGSTYMNHRTVLELQRWLNANVIG